MVDRVEKLLKADPDIEHWSFYVGQGAVRFYLPLDAQLANDFFAQAVVVTKGFKQRARRSGAPRAGVRARSSTTLMARVTPLELGPPVGWPLKFRVSGPDPAKTRELAQAFAQVLGEQPQHAQHQLRLERAGQGDQGRRRPGSGARARASARSSSPTTSMPCCRAPRITQLRDSTYLIDIVARAVPEERAKLETLRNLMLADAGGRSVPLAQVAHALLRRWSRR